MNNGNGTKKKAKLTKWCPKRWELWHTECVLLSSTGMSNTELATKYRKTPQQISNILNTPQAAVLRKHALDGLMEKQLGNMSNKIEAIAVKSLDRVHELIFDDKHFKDSPFSVVDRAIKVLQGAGKMSKDSEGRNTVNKIDKALVLNTTESTELLESLTKAERAKELHSGNEENNPSELSSRNIIAE